MVKQKMSYVNRVVILVGVIIMVLPLLAHAETTQITTFTNPYFLLFIPLALILLGAFTTHHFEKTAKSKRELEQTKKIIFIAIVIITIFFSLFIFISTISTNIKSWTKGPVHWHADLSIEICGKPYRLPESRGLSNKVGTNLLHTHNDDRIHIEGVVMKKHEATLREFLEKINIPFSSNQLAHMQNGDACPNGIPGRVYLYVNGEENFEFEEYTITPYTTVPPGDKIKITFT